jgi:hypothetical protein
MYSGEYGMGTMANELSLGCDCLGQIHYLVRAMPLIGFSLSIYAKLTRTHTTNSLVLLSHMMAVPSNSRMLSAYTKRTMAFFGNIPTIVPMEGLILSGKGDW